jgi:hypothetical protein
MVDELWKKWKNSWNMAHRLKMDNHGKKSEPQEKHPIGPYLGLSECWSQWSLSNSGLVRQEMYKKEKAVSWILMGKCGKSTPFVFHNC